MMVCKENTCEAVLIMEAADFLCLTVSLRLSMTPVGESAPALREGAIASYDPRNWEELLFWYDFVMKQEM